MKLSPQKKLPYTQELPPAAGRNGEEWASEADL